MIQDVAGNQSVEEIIDMETMANHESFLQFGLEIEQPNHLKVNEYRYERELLSKYRDIQKEWTTDYGDLVETQSKPYKSAAFLMRHIVEYFERKFPDWYWEWKSQNHRSSVGCGSHIHFHPNPDYVGDMIKAWTITWNTLVELYPFLYPYFCWTRQSGFRDGANRGFENYAEPVTRRYGQASIHEIYDRRYRDMRDFTGITFNSGEHGGKPLTIEMRVNDNHPAFAIAGAQVLQSWVRECIKRGESPKIESIEGQRRTDGLEYIHERLRKPKIMTMDLIGPIKFVPGRSLPGLDRKYHDLLDFFKDMTYRWWDAKNNYRARISRFLAGDRGSEYNHNPSFIPKKAWYVQGDDWKIPDYMA